MKLRTFDVFSMRGTLLGTLMEYSAEGALKFAQKSWPNRSGLMVEDLEATQRRIEDERERIANYPERY